MVIPNLSSQALKALLCVLSSRGVRILLSNVLISNNSFLNAAINL